MGKRRGGIRRIRKPKLEGGGIPAGLAGLAGRLSAKVSPGAMNKAMGAIPPGASGVTGALVPSGSGAGGGDSTDTASCPGQEQRIIAKIKYFWRNIKNIAVALSGAIKAIWTFIIKSLETIWNFFNSTPGKYLVFILFIMLIFGFGFWFAFSSKSPIKNGGKWPFIGGDGFEKWGYNVDTSWLYKLKIKTAENEMPTITRQSEREGRCDDSKHMELNDSECLNIDIPQTIEWKIDFTKIPEWDSLPQLARDKITKRGTVSTIYIPWDLKDNEFVPNCSNAYFSDGESAGHLFRDNGEICTKVIKEAKRYLPGSIEIEEDDDGNNYVNPTPLDQQKCTL